MGEVEQLQQQVRELDAKVKRLEAQPLSANTSVLVARHLEEPEYVVEHANGEVFAAGDGE